MVNDTKSRKHAFDINRNTSDMFCIGVFFY